MVRMVWWIESMQLQLLLCALLPWAAKTVLAATQRAEASSNQTRELLTRRMLWLDALGKHCISSELWYTASLARNELLRIKSTFSLTAETEETLNVFLTQLGQLLPKNMSRLETHDFLTGNPSEASVSLTGILNLLVDGHTVDIQPRLESLPTQLSPTASKFKKRVAHLWNLIQWDAKKRCHPFDLRGEEVKFSQQYELLQYMLKIDQDISKGNVVEFKTFYDEAQRRMAEPPDPKLFPVIFQAAAILGIEIDTKRQMKFENARPTKSSLYSTCRSFKRETKALSELAKVEPIISNPTTREALEEAAAASIEQQEKTQQKLAALKGSDPKALVAIEKDNFITDKQIETVTIETGPTVAANKDRRDNANAMEYNKPSKRDKSNDQDGLEATIAQSRTKGFAESGIDKLKQPQTVNIESAAQTKENFKSIDQKEADMNIEWLKTLIEIFDFSMDWENLDRMRKENSHEIKALSEEIRDTIKDDYEHDQIPEQLRQKNQLLFDSLKAKDWKMAGTAVEEMVASAEEDPENRDLMNMTRHALLTLAVAINYEQVDFQQCFKALWPQSFIERCKFFLVQPEEQCEKNKKKKAVERCIAHKLVLGRQLNSRESKHFNGNINLRPCIP